MEIIAYGARTMKKIDVQRYSMNEITAKACARQTCEGCEIKGKLLCVHTRQDLANFWVIFMGFAIPFFAGMILGKHWAGLIIWIGLAILFFGYVEAFFLCRHCPHYAEDGFLLRCHANWGLPKIPKFNPKPLNKIEQISWLVYITILFLWYIPFFIRGQQWLLLGLTTWAVFAAGYTLQHNQCRRCYNLSCPLNRVSEDVRKIFFQNYPEFAEAWRIKKEN